MCLFVFVQWKVSLLTLALITAHQCMHALLISHSALMADDNQSQSSVLFAFSKVVKATTGFMRQVKL